MAAEVCRTSLLPKMLAGIASTEEITLTATGRNKSRIRMLSYNKSAEGNQPGTKTVEFKTLRAVAQHVAHGLVIAEKPAGNPIDDVLARGGFTAGMAKHATTIVKGPSPVMKNASPPPVPICRESRHKKRKPDANGKTRRIERDAARGIAWG